MEQGSAAYGLEVQRSSRTLILALQIDFNEVLAVAGSMLRPEDD